MYEFRDPTRLTIVAVGCVALFTALEALFGLILYYEYSTFASFADPFEVRTSDFVAIPMLLMMLACFVAVGMWTYRASANAHTLSSEMTISPGWAVGWYFVPIMNLFRPYQAMREIWIASHLRGHWGDRPTPGLLGWWWGLWIVTNILGNISFRLTLSDDAYSYVDTITYLDLAGTILGVPLGVILIAILRRTARAQLAARHDDTFA